MGSLGSGVRSPAAARGGPQRWLPPQAASLPTQLRAGLFNLLGGLVCRITAFLAKDRAVRKDEVDTILGRQEGFVLSESCGSSCLWDDVFDGHLGFPGHLGLEDGHIIRAQTDVLVTAHQPDRAESSSIRVL